jgi:UDP-N-acetylglucosamine--N-acetylmuramyl-(pentapeptide) pyrophosphoryl-undecaprenol N-acetylglucosamine transferase
VSRKFAPHAAGVSLAFESAAEFINNKNIQINGNPIRKKFATLPKNSARENLGLKNKRTLCIMGGSQGARTINDAAVELLKTFSQECGMQVISQTGKKNFERVIEQLLKIYPEYETDKNLLIKPYFEDMVSVLKASDIAVSRAGSLSLSELCASGVVPIIVPYPHAAADHQRKNAQYMVEKGAALTLEDSELTKHTLKRAVLHLLENDECFDNIRRNVSALAKFDATEKIIKQLKESIRR